MPAGTDIERRNRALVVFTILTGARDRAIASIMKLKHVDLIAGCVNQDAREVRTKFSKTFTTYFFPVAEEIREIVKEWVEYLRNVKLWSNDDPLFSVTRVTLGANHQFAAEDQYSILEEIVAGYRYTYSVLNISGSLRVLGYA